MTNWTTILSVIGSLVVASTAQVISHLFTQRREKQKYNKECLQNLYSPIIFPIIEYINGEAYRTSLIESEDFDEEELQEDPKNPDTLFKEVIEHIGKNLKYSEAEMIMKYEEAKIMIDLVERYKDGYRDERDLCLQYNMDLCSECLTEFIKISKKLGSLSNHIRDKVIPPLFFTQFYLLLTDYECYSLKYDAPKLVNYLDFINLSKQNKWLIRIIDVRRRINDKNEKLKDKDYIDKEKTSDVFQEAYDLIMEIINEFYERDPDTALSWQRDLESDWNLRGKILG